jgi:ribosomal protein S17
MQLSVGVVIKKLDNQSIRVISLQKISYKNYTLNLKNYLLQSNEVNCECGDLITFKKSRCFSKKKIGLLLKVIQSQYTTFLE